MRGANILIRRDGRRLSLQSIDGQVTKLLTHRVDMDIHRREIIRAYRSLYRAGLHAVQYSRPARYVLKATLEDAFRSTPADKFHARRIGNTILFLENAAKARGMEHRILKNLIHVRWWEREKALGLKQ